MPVQVMIVDDSASSRTLIRHHLEGLGCKVVAEAENACEALRLYDVLAGLEAQRPNFVTLDLVMQHVDGVDALTAFRELRRKDPSIPILIISAIPFEKTRQTFINEGALDYLIKPFNRFHLGQIRIKLERLFPDLKFPQSRRPG